MIKKKGIRIGILTVIFIVAVIFFGYLTNKGNTNMSAAMESATLPTIHFVTEGYEVNSLAGYVTDMEITSMRDTLTMVTDQLLHMSIQAYEQEIQKVTWQVFTLDGQNCLQKETIDGAEQCDLQFYDNGMLDVERVLKVTLHMSEKDVYYYTRIKDSDDCNYSECVKFAKEFQEKAFAGSDKEHLETYLESSAGGNADGFHKVTLASSVEYLTWGDLKPELASDIRLEVKECNETYTSLMLTYRAQCKEDEARTCEYDIEEFYRVRVYNGKTYLMDYERTMEQSFEGNEQSISAKGIELGIASEKLEYQCNSAGTIVAFVQNDELWTYDSTENEFSFVFGFAEAEKEDERNYFNRHEIHINSIDEQGNVLFYVLGYMNRGPHEGETGIAIYYFENLKSSITEKAFVSSKKGYEVMREELGTCIHYSIQKNILYVMLDGYLYQVDMNENTKQLLVRGLTEEQYVLSEDGNLLLYQNAGPQNKYSDKLIFLNLDTGLSFEIKASQGEYLKPAGFINEDLVYGFMKSEDAGVTLTGESLLPMYALEIMTQEQKIVKNYQVENVYIQEVSIMDNVLEMERVMKNDATYRAIEADYITSNEESEASSIWLTAATDEIHGKVQRLQFSEGLDTVSVRLMKPKFALQEKRLKVSFDEAKMKGHFYVYARGWLQASYDNAGEAIRHANELRAVVISSEQAYVWERGNWPSADEIEGISTFLVEEGENTVEACIAKIIEKEGIAPEVNVRQKLADGKTIVEILSDYSGGEGMDLTGCSMEELQYTLSKEKPIIAMVGADDAILLTGYNKTNIAYIDPVTGSKKIVTKERMQQMTEPYGSVFFGYVK